MRLITFARGLGLGAVLMYYVDPERGVRRRAIVREKMTHNYQARQDRELRLA